MWQNKLGVDAWAAEQLLIISKQEFSKREKRHISSPKKKGETLAALGGKKDPGGMKGIRKKPQNPLLKLIQKIS